MSTRCFTALKTASLCQWKQLVFEHHFKCLSLIGKPTTNILRTWLTFVDFCIYLKCKTFTGFNFNQKRSIWLNKYKLKIGKFYPFFYQIERIGESRKNFEVFFRSSTTFSITVTSCQLTRYLVVRYSFSHSVLFFKIKNNKLIFHLIPFKCKLFRNP